ncbi:MAG: hypothetical protein ACMG6E_07350 [Candidatus Roizmanbacteria bacterium]
MLSACNQTFDFTEIIQKSNKYIFRSLMEYNFACLKYSSIAMGSLMIALEILGYQNFKQGIIAIIEENQISFDVGEIQQCKAAIIHYFLQNDEEFQTFESEST